MRLTGGGALAAQLVREGVDTLFGVPGVQLDWAMDGVARQGERLRYLVTRHEQAAAYMADGYARASGRTGVCMVVPGPGVLNAAAGLATAYACSSPVVLLAGQIPSAHLGKGLGLLHEIPDQSAILASLTKWSALARSPAQVPGLLRQAVHQAHSGRPRPVALELPPDVLAREAATDLVLPDPEPAQRTAPDPAAVACVAARLRAAHRPLIVAGGGVIAADAGQALADLAERLQAPVVMTANGRGSLSDRHPLALTPLALRQIAAEADLVLAVGSRFVTGQGTALVEGAAVVLVNADGADLGPPRGSDAAVLADARLALEAVAAELSGVPRPAAPWADLERLRRECDREVRAVQPQADWLTALRDAIPEDGVLVTELTQVGYLSRVGYPVYGPRTYLTPGYQGTLGYGFPTALGAKRALPERAVVSITGDGGFGWALQELATARQHELGVVTVVFSDGAFGNVLRTQEERFGGRVVGTRLLNPDFPALARAFGVDGVRADDPAQLRGALREALAAGRPALIEVPVGRMPSAWHLLADQASTPVRRPSAAR